MSETPAVADPRTLLAKYGLAAKKSWGQNFLISERVYAAIVRAAVRAEDEWVVEIGAGLGTLTVRLANAASRGRVIAVEKDRDMADVLRAELGTRPNVEIREENALTFDYAALGRKVALAGNLPYQIASPLIFSMIDARAHLSRMVIMVQKEMADRVVAAPGTKAYGALGVMVTTYCDVRRVSEARAGAFHPQPKVDSTVVELTPLPATRAPIDDAERYHALVHAAFGQRRKTLRNALRARWEDGATRAALECAAIDGQRRGETLTVAEFARLANALPAARPT